MRLIIGACNPLFLMYFWRYVTFIKSFSFLSFSRSQSAFNYATVYSRLILALFLIFLALTPNLNVEIVSARLKKLGEHVIIRVVLEFPPSDSYNILVNYEFLYGTY